LWLVNLFYEPYNTKHTKTLNNDFLQIIDDNKSWFTVNYRKRYIYIYIYSVIYWKFIGRIEHVFFLQILHAEKTLEVSRRTRAVTWRERLCVRGSKWRQISVCVKIARALGLEHALLLSSTVENRAHTGVWRHFACVRRPCGNDAFFSV